MLLNDKCYTKNTQHLLATNDDVFILKMPGRKKKKTTSKDKTDNGAMTFLPPPSPRFFQQVPNEHVTGQN